MSALGTGLIAVGLGSAVGAWARWGLSAWLNPRFVFFPLGTFIANAIGGFLVGLAVAVFRQTPGIVARMAVISGDRIPWRLDDVLHVLGGSRRTD